MVALRSFPLAAPARSFCARLAVLSLSTASLGLLAGCSMQSAAPNTGVNGPAIQGTVHGGSQAISGAHVYLYEVNPSEHAGASTSLLNIGDSGITADGNQHGYVTTAADGTFNITGDYTCTDNGETYLYVTNGNPGVAPTVADPTPNNSGLALMTALGKCSTDPSISNIIVDEVSTVAAVYSLQQFMADGQDVGAIAGNQTGLNNAFAMVPNLVDLGTSAVRSTNLAGTGSTPRLMINTLGNILASCVNSVDQVTPSAGFSQNCQTLFTAATPQGSNQPTNTVSALLLIAQNPTSNTTNLFNLAAASGAPYQPSYPSLSYLNSQGAQQNLSFTLGITYTGGGLSYPGAVAIDANGVAWVLSCPSCTERADGSSPTGPGGDALIEFNPLLTTSSTPIAYTTGISQPQSVAIDASGNLWTTNLGGGTNPSVQVFTNEGASVGAYPYTSGLAEPEQIAIDANGNAWVTDAGNNDVIQLSPGSTTAPLQTASMTNFSYPLGVAIDNSGDVFAAGYLSNSILKIAGGSASSVSQFSGNGLNNPIGIAVDDGPDVWAANNNDTVSEFNGSNGATVGNSPFSGGTLQQAATVAIDGSGNVLIPNCRSYASCMSANASGTPQADNLVILNQAGNVTTGANGIQDPNFAGVGIGVIDETGNVWVSNNAGASLTEILGLAVPVQTPTAVQVADHTVGLPAGTSVIGPAIAHATAAKK